MARPPARRLRPVSRRRAGAAALVVLSAVAIMAAGERRVRAAGRYGPGPRTFVADAVASPLDVPGLVAPVALTRARGSMFILDGATRRLVPLDRGAPRGASTGDAGPPPWRLPVPIDATAAADAVSILDAAAATLYRTDAAGRVLGRRSLAAVSPPMAGCLLDDGSVILLTEGADDALASVGADGQVRWRRPLPWPEAQARHALARQGFTALGRDGRSCVIALAFGPGWLWIDRHGAIRALGDWRDRAPSPRVRSVRSGARLTGGTPVAHAITLRDDTLEVVVAGPTGVPLRVVDRIALASGRYLGSVLLPRVVTALTAVPGGWVAIALRGGRAEPVRFALRDRRVGIGGSAR